MIDIENLMGGPHAGAAAAIIAAVEYAGAVHVKETDHVIVGCNPGLAIEARVAIPKGQLVIGSGPDGADLALLRKLKDVDWLAERYGRVVFGSGDAIFALTARSLRERGTWIGVVALQNAVSRTLARQSDFVRLLPTVMHAGAVA